MLMNATSCQALGEERARIQGCPCLRSWAPGPGSALASPPTRRAPRMMKHGLRGSQPVAIFPVCNDSFRAHDGSV